jgi:hypothetical protein
MLCIGSFLFPLSTTDRKFFKEYKKKLLKIELKIQTFGVGSILTPLYLVYLGNGKPYKKCIDMLQTGNFQMNSMGKKYIQIQLLKSKLKSSSHSSLYFSKST